MGGGWSVDFHDLIRLVWSYDHILPQGCKIGCLLRRVATRPLGGLPATRPPFSCLGWALLSFQGHAPLYGALLLL